MPIDPEALRIAKQDPNFDAILKGPGGQSFLARQQSSEQGVAYGSLLEPFTNFGYWHPPMALPPGGAEMPDTAGVAGVAGMGYFYPGGPGTTGGPEGALFQRLADEQGLRYTKDYVLDTATGRALYRNGTIFDPTSGQVVFAPGTSTAGSEPWRREVLDWSEEKVENWRKRLASFGYEIPKQGGVDEDFIAKLTEFHIRRYQNYGRNIPVSPEEGGTDPDEMAAARITARQTVRSRFEQVFGRDPSEGEEKGFAQVYMDGYRRALRKGRSPIVAGARAEEIFEQTFSANPKVQFAEEAENTELPDALVSVAAINAI